MTDTFQQQVNKISYRMYNSAYYTLIAKLNFTSGNSRCWPYC